MRTNRLKQLIEKYNTSGPRYTSYPSVPLWKTENFTLNNWTESILQNCEHFSSQNISLYLHLPFCESLCTFCGCHKYITKNHNHEAPYITALIKEFEIYKSVLPYAPNIKELHLGGGTPTFFSVEELRRLLNHLFDNQIPDPNECALSFEAHPNNTTDEHLKVLFSYGFRRLSLGIQDYDPIVQKAIHRILSFDQVKQVHETAKNIGYTSISHDLVYGLPKQDMNAIVDTVKKTIQLKPERISLYSYAHVPWIKGNGQRGFDENDLPQDDEKRALYECAKAMLLDAGYLEIGMDHFALPDDELAKAFTAKKLHRNFMGYTTQDTSTLIGLGMSAISDSWFGFAQNSKSLPHYLEQVNDNQLPVIKGHLLSEEDLTIRQKILDLMCHFETRLTQKEIIDFPFIRVDLIKDMENDGLLIFENDLLVVTPQGVPFVRNICMCFDQYLPENNTSQMFSKTI